MENLLPVETFREYIAYNMFHFWGLSGESAPVNSACNTIVHEYAWQMADAAGRDDVRLAIIEAEKKFRSHLGYSTTEHYISESINLGCFKHYNQGGYTYQGFANGLYNPGYQVLVQLSEGQVKAIQTESLGVLLAGAAVTYTDDDGDGNLDRFQILVTDSVSDPALIELRFAAADVPFSYSLDRRKIGPIYVDRKDPATIRIQGPAWIMVAPKKYGAYNYASLRPDQSATFVSTADVYIRTVTNSGQASLSYYDANNALQSVVMTAEIYDADSGLVKVRSSQCIDFCFCGSRRDQNLVMNYRAGAAAGEFAAEVTYLAVAELRRRVCACDDANGQLYKWQVDLALPAGPSMARINIHSEDLANPIGTRAGQLSAWKKIQLYRQVHGHFVG